MLDILVSQKHGNGTRRKRKRDVEDRRGSGSMPGSFAGVIIRRHIIIYHPSLINAKGEVCIQLPSIIHCHHVRTRTRTHVCTHTRTHVRMPHGVTRTRVSYERRGCVELVQGIFETKKKPKR